ncbi:uncharacterized protein [Prorops nasuta]|uniref:uncharacterized protein isoform X1 n=1 Tax=Prorops nasuta TaxID=863751 RepID=UPI0034CD6AD5
MDRIMSMGWLNKVLFVMSILCSTLMLIMQEWAGLSRIPIYITISWAVFLIIISIWFSCVLLKMALKVTTPINIDFLNKWVCSKFNRLQGAREFETFKSITGKQNENNKKSEREHIRYVKNLVIDNKDQNIRGKNVLQKTNALDIPFVTPIPNSKIDINFILNEIDGKCINIWYKNVSNDDAFPNETQELLRKLMNRLFWQIGFINKVKFSNKVADVFLLHLKEYRKALRRFEKGLANSTEEAYKCSHPGSQNILVLEHILHHLLTVLAQEFLHWELTNSLPCKLLLSILAKRLFSFIQLISSPRWIFENIHNLLQATPNADGNSDPTSNGVVSMALSNGIVSVTAAVIPRPLPKAVPDIAAPKTDNNFENIIPKSSPEKPELRLEGLSEHRGLWGDINIEADSELDEDRISPVYEEPTDFATTIARLRNLLQQKSTATTPLPSEERSYAMYEGNQFTNLCIPWTEFHTAVDGSQQLLYCIQFDDVEQHGVDLFETTTATVKRQYFEFVQLHNNLEEITSLSNIMSGIVLPEGGRVEMENYLITLCTRLSNENPSLIRHFLRPNSNTKKADTVAPRLDRFLAKTVTGVFNTLKTVVPRFEIDQEEEVTPIPTLMPLIDFPWRFVEDIKSKNFALKLQELLDEKIDYYSVDTAYEAVEAEILSQWWQTVKTPYDEELDELDSNLPLTCVIIDLMCEILTGIGSNSNFQQESVVRWIKLLFGGVSEPVIKRTILWLCNYINNISFSTLLQSEINKEPSNLEKDEILQLILDKIPYDLKLIIGQEDAKEGLRYLLSSFEISKLNLDLYLQILDILASELLISCKEHHGNFSP